MSIRKFSVTMSRDNFDNCLLTFLRATSTIHDNEDAKLIKFSKNKDNSIHLDIVTTTERQLELPFTNRIDVV